MHDPRRGADTGRDDPLRSPTVTIRVVGAGLGRTGTTSLKAALEQLLGGRCHHMFEVVVDQDEQVPAWRAACRGEPVDWDRVLDGYVAVVDWPGAAFWRELSDRWPDALVLVSNRDFDAWYESAHNTIWKVFDTEPDPDDAWRAFVGELFERRFTDDLHDRDAVRAAFDAHHAAVREHVPAERRLEWSVADGWAPIAEALGVPVPDEPFPRLNTSEDWAPKD